MNATFLCMALLVPGYGEKDILQQLQKKGARVSPSGIQVILPGAEDADLGELCELRNLKGLDLCGAKVTDKGLHTLAGLRGLKYLTIEGGNITDKGLRDLESMSNLRILSLEGCPNITHAGVVRLEKALPDCVIGGP